MSETRAGRRNALTTQRERTGRAAHAGGAIAFRELSLRGGLEAMVNQLREYLFEIGRFINKDGRIASFDFFGSPGQFLYQNRNYSETIDTGAILVRNRIPSFGIYVVTVDTESAAASDDLDTITLFPEREGNILILKAEDSARTVVVKNGTGNITLEQTLGDFSMDSADDTITLLQVSDGSFLELSRSDNG